MRNDTTSFLAKGVGVMKILIVEDEPDIVEVVVERDARRIRNIVERLLAFARLGKP